MRFTSRHISALNPASVQFLLTHGVQINAADGVGDTFLTCFARTDGNYSLVKWLIEKGADVNVSGDEGI